MKKIIILSLSLITSICAYSQIAYLNIDSVLAVMPEAKNADLELKTYGKLLSEDLSVILDSMKVVDQNAAKLKQAGDLSQNEEQKIISQLNGMQQRANSLKQTIDRKFENKRIELLSPILKKIEDAVKQIAAEKNYMAVLGNKDAFFYINEKIDITSLVKVKLGL